MDQGSAERDVGSVIITDELDRRPSRSPDYQSENGALTALAQALSTDPTTVLQQLAELAMDLTHSGSTGISLLEPGGEQGTFRWVATAGAWSPYRDGTMPREASPCREVIAQDAVLLMTYLERSFPALSLAEPGASEALLAPFYVGGVPAGTLWSIKHNPGEHFEAEDARLLKSLARFASAAHQTVQAQQMAVAAGGQAELRAQQLVTLADVSSEFFGICDMEFMPIYGNAAAMRMVGLADLEQVQRTPLQEFFFPEDLPFITDEFLPRVLREGQAKVEIRFRHFVTGEPVWVDYSLVALKDEMGRTTGLGTVTHDLTKRKRAEMALRVSEARLRQAHEMGGIGSWQWKHAAGRGEVSASYRKIHGMAEGTAPISNDALLASIHPDDHARLRAAVQQGLLSGERIVAEYRVLLPGEAGLRWIRATGQRVGTGIPEITAGIVEDITERHANNALVRAQADELASIFAAAPVGLCVLDQDLRYLRMNERLAAFSGVSAADYIGRTPEDTLPQFESQGAEIMQRVLAGEAVMGAEFVGEMPGKPGAIRTWRANLIPLRNGDHEITGIAVAADEITEEKEAAEKLSRALERAEIAQAAARAVLYDFDPVTGKANASLNFSEITGYPPDTIVSLDWWQSLVHPADRALFSEMLESVMKQGSHYSLEYRLLHQEGHWLWVADRGRAVPIGDGGLHRLVGMFIDISEQRQAQQALIESEARYRAVFEQVGIGVARLSLDGRFIQVNDRYCTVLGRSREELVGKRWQDITHPDDLAQDIARRDQLLAGDGASFAIEKRYVGQEGSEIWVNLTLSLVRDAADVPAFYVAMVEDIGAKKQTEAAFADSEATMRTLMEAAPVGLIFADATGQVTHANPRFVEIIGHPLLNSPNIDAYGEYVSFHADGRQVEAREYPFARVLTGEAERAELEVLYRRGDGRDVWVRTVAAALRSANGTLLGAVGAMLDIDRETRLTQQLAREVEHAVAERQTALAQLFEAQKLETIGQLTGGVAHDFNNLLTPIMGVLEMMQHRVAGEDRASRLVAGALQSAERAKNLVQRLLAFARRQNLETKAIDLADLIAGMRDLIERSIGPTIAVEVALGDALCPVSADANQLELALLNLAVNARDAMPGGGMLHFAARREAMEVTNALQLGAGSYICLAVSDTGAGMDAETLKRCIEPFFTSKGIGEGTGLGLSMVHGMMRQLGGALNIISAPGQGTTMELWLACSDEQPEANPVERAGLPQSARRSTILLVDDDELVRESTADMLDRLGYDVVQASNGPAALAVLAAPNAIDALVTDYLMPGMTGRELAEQARRDRPDLPVLLITGYTRLDEIGPDLARLEKPFRQADFAARVAELVGGG